MGINSSKILSGAERWEVIRRKWLEPNDSKGNFLSVIIKTLVKHVHIIAH